MSFEQIIVEIKKRPVLWMSSNPSYKYRAIKSKLWRELSMKLGVEVEILKKRWKHLKDQYRKELKKKPESKPGIKTDFWVSSWKYFDSMEFIKEELLRTPSNRNLSSLDAEGNYSIVFKLPIKEESTDIDIADSFVASLASQQSSVHSIPLKTRKRQLEESDTSDKRKMIKLIEKLVEESSQEDDLWNDPDYLFLRSLLPSMKKLSDCQKLCLRGKIIDWLLQELAPKLNE